MKTLMIGLAAFAALSASAAETPPFTVDFSKEVGRIKRLNGVCNAAPLSNSHTKSINDMVLKLEIPYYRFHDASLENPGIQLVDVRRIFPLLHADADDPANYDFRATDDYLRQAVDAGAKLEFRLGESIEHSRRQYLVTAPPDYEKWADVCCHIIRHYNEGWANGFKWNIERWAIWEEPDTVPQLLAGAPDAFRTLYLPLYATAARRIKKEFPNLKVGGPQGFRTWHMRDFVDYCAANRLPLDFYGFTAYVRDPEDYAKMVREIRAYLDEKGYEDTTVTLSEWHWGPVSWRGHGTFVSARYAKAWSEELAGHDSTAFTAAALIRMQDEPVDAMAYYAMSAGECGAWGLFDENRQPQGSYWAFLAFAQLAHGEIRVETPTVPRERWYALASKDPKTGRGHVLVAALRTDGTLTPLTLRGGVKPVSVKVIDPIHDLEEVEGWKWDAVKGELFIPRDLGDSTVWLVETESAAADGEVKK